MLYRIPDNRVRRSYRGGRELDRLAGVAAPADGDRPEDWILSTVAAVNPGMEPRPGEGLSRLELPDGTVTTLAERIARAPEAPIGPATAPPRRSSSSSSTPPSACTCNVTRRSSSRAAT